MTKEEAKQKLRKSGYNVIEDNSVVTVVIGPDVSMKNAVKDVKSKLGDWGYNASFGVRQHKGNELFDNIENETDDTDDYEDLSVNSEGNNEPALSEENVPSKPEEEIKETPQAELSDDEYFDEEDSDMLLTEDSIQFSLEDFGLDF